MAVSSIESLLSGEPYLQYYLYSKSESGSRIASRIGNSYRCSQEIALWDQSMRQNNCYFSVSANLLGLFKYVEEWERSLSTKVC